MSLSDSDQLSDMDRSVFLADVMGTGANRGRTGSGACFFPWVMGMFSKWNFITVTVLSVNHPIYVIFPAAPPIMATFATKNKEIKSS